MNILSLEELYVFCGIILLLVSGRIALQPLQEKRWGSALFWGLLGVTFVAGKWMSPLAVGYLVIAMVVLASLRQVSLPFAAGGTTREARVVSAGRFKNWLFLPALLIPIVAVWGTLQLADISWGNYHLVDPKQVTLVSLGLGAIIALLVAMRITRAKWNEPMGEGSRLLQTVGWSLILPQLLAALGGIFAKVGVGDVISGLVAQALPTYFPFVGVLAYCLGMAIFTMVMGNAFAAFAVITGGIGLPIVVQQHGGNPAIMAAIGMLSGYCGTLLTPMAANFNLVPAMLLELPDKNAVIKAQIPIGLTLLAVNVVVMYVCVYRF